MPDFTSRIKRIFKEITPEILSIAMLKMRALKIEIVLGNNPIKNVETSILEQQLHLH